MDTEEIRRYIEVDRSYPEKYIGKPVSEWRNYNRIYNLWNFSENFSKFYMRTYMARGVLTNIINPTDDF